MDTAIPETNRGFRLLQLMGWKVGQGLGKTAQGRSSAMMILVLNYRVGYNQVESTLSGWIPMISRWD